MPTIPYIIAARRKNRRNNERPLMRWGTFGCITTIGILIAVLFLSAAAIYAAILQGIPSIETIPILLEPPNGLLLSPTRFYDRSGEYLLKVLENPAITRRVYAPLAGEDEAQSISPFLVEAVIAYQDPTFWSHPGFVSLSNPPASLSLAEQLVADLLLWDEPAGTRRLWRQRLLATQITNQFGREKVLEWYLNNAYFGNQLYGVAAAAEAYFGKAAGELSLAEAATLAAVLETPTINPHSAPEEARERAFLVLDTMLAQGLISSNEALEAREEKITFRPPVASEEDIAPAFIELVWEQLSELLPPERIRRGGFEIITTLDYDLQTQSRCVTQAHIAQLTRRQNERKNCQAARLLPTLANPSLGSSQPQANVLITDPATGQVLAMVGEATPGADPVHLPGHPPGSLLTPFLYLTAFTRGFNPASLLWDIPTLFPEEITAAANPTGDFQGPLRLRNALATDALVPALTVLERVGAMNLWRTLEKFGINLNAPPPDETSGSCSGCDYLLGEGEITLMDVVQAYAVLANRGNFAGEVSTGEENPQFSAITIQAVRDQHGTRWFNRTASDILPITSEQLAYLLNHILSDESARWPRLGHPNMLEIGRPVAAKIGRTPEGQDSWTIGYTPQIVVGVWVGLEASAPVGVTLPPEASAALWRAVMQYATRELPSVTWEAPPGISTMAVCDPSGMLPTVDCPTVVSDVFLSGHEPTHLDTLFRRYQINRETGRLATVFTPPELIEERVYMLVPPEASSWAKEAGIPTPPTAYDVIHMPTPSSEAVITSPQIFTTLGGEIAIQGTAAGEDFVSYRVQVGQGLNPQSWLALGDPVTTPVENGLLASWDTSGLNGLYAIQLIVLRSGQRAETHTIQVTIDNQPPEVTILYPEESQVFEYQAMVPITFQAQTSDNTGISRLDYYLDDRLLNSQTQPPFALPWLPRLGKHTLTIVTVDRAGNETQASITFSVTR